MDNPKRRQLRLENKGGINIQGLKSLEDWIISKLFQTIENLDPKEMSETYKLEELHIKNILTQIKNSRELKHHVHAVINKLVSDGRLAVINRKGTIINSDRVIDFDKRAKHIKDRIKKEREYKEVKYSKNIKKTRKRALPTDNIGRKKNLGIKKRINKKR
tara:strand:+ start:1435 stop:1914 length:480 start_codon:yes stop_codon:yes gene_type:complete